MSNRILVSFACGAIALSTAACAAVAAPVNPAAIDQSDADQGPLVLVRGGGGGGGGGGHGGGGFGGSFGGGFGGGHGGFGGFQGHAMGGPHVASRSFGSQSRFHGQYGHNFRHGHNRFFFAGYPYFDDYYDSACWWSGRYHRWVCPDY